MKINNLKKTVTIGIAAFNEEKNIISLLKSILEQENNYYVLKEVLVFSDGSTDKTNTLLKKVSKHSKKLKVHIDNKRRGKAYRLQQMYTKAKSDILVTIDSDVTLRGKSVIDQLIKALRDDKVGLVFGNVLPVSPSNFFQKIITTYEAFWKKTINQINEGNNIHNCLGCILALKKEFYKTISLPSSIVADDHFIYLSAVKNGFRREYARDAVVYFTSPKTMNDYLSQFRRYFTSLDAIEAHFGEFASSFYRIPRVYKLNAYKKSFIENPVFMVLAIALQVYQRLHIKPTRKESIWEIAVSSK